MNKYLALLRAINVGGHTVKMVDLQQYFVEMGFNNVLTYIQSGNVLFESNENNSTKLETVIEASLQKILGYEVIAMIRTAPEMKQVVDHNPFVKELTKPGMMLYLAYLKNPPTKELIAQLSFLRTDVDTFVAGEQEIYWLYDKSSGESAFTRKPLEKQLKVPMTLRNWNVTQKLAELVALRH